MQMQFVSRESVSEWSSSRISKRIKSLYPTVGICMNTSVQIRRGFYGRHQHMSPRNKTALKCNFASALRMNTRIRLHVHVYTHTHIYIINIFIKFINR